MPQPGLQQPGGQSSIAAPSLLLPGDARGVGFTPASLPGLVLWLDAGAVGQADNTSVARWADLSGLGNDAVQGTVAHQPTYQAAGLNGHPAIRGDGVDDGLAETMALATTAESLVLAFQAVALPTAGAFASLARFLSASALISEVLLMNGVGGYQPLSVLFGGVGGTPSVGVAATLDLLPHVLAISYVGSGPTLPASYVVALDGVARAVVASGAFGAGFTGSLFSRSGGSAVYSGNLGVVLRYARSLSVTELHQCSVWAGQRWGVTIQ